MAAHAARAFVHGRRVGRDPVDAGGISRTAVARGAPKIGDGGVVGDQAAALVAAAEGDRVVAGGALVEGTRRVGVADHARVQEELLASVLEDHAEPVAVAVPGDLTDVVEHHQAVAGAPPGAEEGHRLIAVDGGGRQIGRGRASGAGPTRRVTGLQVQQRRQAGGCRAGAEAFFPEVARRRVAQPAGEEGQHVRADPLGLAAVADSQEVGLPVQSRRVPGGAHVRQVLQHAGKRLGNHLRDIPCRDRRPGPTGLRRTARRCRRRSRVPRRRRPRRSTACGRTPPRTAGRTSTARRSGRPACAGRRSA